MSFVEEAISGYKSVYQDRSGAEPHLSSWQVDFTGFRFFNFDVRRSCAVEFAVARSVSPVATELGCEVLDLSFANIVTKRLFGNVVRLLGGPAIRCAENPSYLVAIVRWRVYLCVRFSIFVLPFGSRRRLDFNLFWVVTERSVRFGLAHGNLAFNGNYQRSCRSVRAQKGSES